MSVLRTFPFKLIGYYYSSHILYNGIFAVLSFLITGFNFKVLIYTFITLGSALAFLLFYLWHEPEYYFYYNRGLSKIKLMSFAYALNLLIAITLWIFFKKVGLW